MSLLSTIILAQPHLLFAKIPTFQVNNNELPHPVVSSQAMTVWQILRREERRTRYFL
jgi:hypothetical protein